MTTELDLEWVHVAFDERAKFNETYGFAGNQGAVNLEGIRIRSKEAQTGGTLLIYMHPASTLQLLPVPRAMAMTGVDVLCAASRYQRNDAALIMEKVLVDLGTWVRHAKQVWRYRKVVLVGWSGGGSLAVTYQAQAEHTTLLHTPAGDEVDLINAGLIPADAVIYQAAHLSRAHLLADAIDPSVRNEMDPDDRDIELDIYDPRNPNKPPYATDYIAKYRAAQLERVRKITRWTRATLQSLRQRGTSEVERCFVVHRTLADPRFLDPSLDANDRRPGWCYMGNPETVNTGPVGLARFSTLRSWLSQWSLDDTCANGLKCAGTVTSPILVIENSADDAVPQTHPRHLFEAAASTDKEFHVIQGATHYYAGQPELLGQATELTRQWLIYRDLLHP